jgi:multicomponent Na+:H+ antiporter subunit G
MDAATVLEAIRSIVGGLFALVGLLFIAGGTIGFLRFPDFYTRLHASGVADGVGAVIVIAGLAVLASDWALVARLLLLACLVIALGPTLSQLAANAAHAAGLAPLAGRYAAPRPGAPRREEPR